MLQLAMVAAMNRVRLISNNHATAKLISLGYLLVALLVGAAFTAIDRLFITLIVRLAIPRSFRCGSAGRWFHATAQPFLVLDLTTGTGQLGQGLYLHREFVTRWDRSALEITPAQPLDDLHVARPYAWQYFIATGHYILSMWIPKKVCSNAIVSRYVWPKDRVEAPEFAYPGIYHQIRLADSPRNRQWLETAQMRWIRLTPEENISLPDAPPTFAWKTEPDAGT